MRKKLYLLGTCIIVVISILSAQTLSAQWITERFGGNASTLDHFGVMKDAWFGYYAGDGHPGHIPLYHEQGYPFEEATGMARRNAVYVDLSFIPIGTQIIKAEYVMPYDMNIYPFSANGFNDGISLYQILDPSGTGMWNENHVGTRSKDADAGIPWSESGTFADCVNPVPVATVYGNGMGNGTKMFYFFDITDLVQGWVDSPSGNMGFTFDATVPSDAMTDPDFRPYLEVTYESVSGSPPDQPLNLNVFYRSGQVFITWTETPYPGQFYDMLYRIYRHTEPILQSNLMETELVGEVDQLSSYNARRSEVMSEEHNYIIMEDDSELSDDTGLFVYTVKNPGEYYYAVTSVYEGYENRSDFSSDNSLLAPVSEAVGLPGAICQDSFDDNGNTIQTFVHFSDDTMSYKRGHGFNFMINLSSNYSPATPAAIEVVLGGRSTTYYTTWCYNGMITIRPDDYMPPTRNKPYDGYQYDNLQTWWSGCRNNYKTQEDRSQGIFVPYTENRILFYIDYAKSKYNINNNRVYLRGGSMGGTGTMSLGLKHPEVFAYICATVGCPNWRLNVHGIDENYNVEVEGWRNEGKKLWGDFDDNVRNENGIIVWDWMDAGWYALGNVSDEAPFLSLNNGKKDGSIQYYPLPQFYLDMKEAKRGFVARFYDGGHSGYGSVFGPRFGNIVKNESFPALNNVSMDDNPGAVHEPSKMALVIDFNPSPPVFDGDPAGEINGYNTIEWSRELYQFSSSPEDDMIDLSDRYEIALRLEDDCPELTATADITPRRLQNFFVSPGAKYHFENKRLATGEIIQNGIVTADNNGLITVPGFIIERETLGNKLIIVPDTSTEIEVSTVGELTDAVNNLQSNTTILIEDGIYDITNTLVVGDSWSEGEEPLSNIVIRSKSGNRDSVLLRAPGWDQSTNANNVFLFRHVIDFILADLSISNTYWHAIQIQGENGANRPILRNLHLIDAGEQFIKVCRDEVNERFCDDGIVENCLIEFTDHARIHPYLGIYYTDGVDVLGGTGWIIRDNIFKNIRAPHGSGMIAGAAILMWHKSKDTIVERNRFIECDLGIHFGNPAGQTDDHLEGIIRNNFFHRATGNPGDTGISLNRARLVKVYHNTIILNDTFPWTIEYRYATPNGDICGDIRYNLTDGPIAARDGGTAYLESNLTDPDYDWFVDPDNADLHLTADALLAINQIGFSPDTPDDIDGEPRPINGLSDIGADEYGCMADFDEDGDVDGSDLATFAADFQEENLGEFAAAFGR